MAFFPGTPNERHSMIEIKLHGVSQGTRYSTPSERCAILPAGRRYTAAWPVSSTARSTPADPPARCHRYHHSRAGGTAHDTPSKHTLPRCGRKPSVGRAKWCTAREKTTTLQPPPSMRRRKGWRRGGSVVHRAKPPHTATLLTTPPPSSHPRRQGRSGTC